MYPSLGDFSRPNSSAHSSGARTEGAYSSQAAPRWPPPLLSASAQNGPDVNLPSTPSGGVAGSQNFPTLRVQVADQYRTFPPVMLNPGLDEIPRSSFNFDFSYEQQVLRRLQSSANSSTNRAATSAPLQNSMERFKQLGYSHEEVSLALAAAGGAEDVDDNKVVQFCKNYKELKSMGFDSASVVGALVLHKSDLQAATDACLTTQT